VVSFTPRPLYHWERAPGIHWIGGWVYPRAGLNDAEKRQFLTLPELELRPLCRPARSESLYRLRHPTCIKLKHKVYNSTWGKNNKFPGCLKSGNITISWVTTRLSRTTSFCRDRCTCAALGHLTCTGTLNRVLSLTNPSVHWNHFTEWMWFNFPQQFPRSICKVIIGTLLSASGDETASLVHIEISTKTSTRRSLTCSKVKEFWAILYRTYTAI
jgi:hypothetical protein